MVALERRIQAQTALSSLGGEERGKCRRRSGKTQHCVCVRNDFCNTHTHTHQPLGYICVCINWCVYEGVCDGVCGEVCDGVCEGVCEDECKDVCA